MNVIYISGGQRSGKSEFAEKLALGYSESPIYIATSRIWDAEHGERIKLHQERRKESWQNVEEEKWISAIKLEGGTALLDCITLWITNFFDDAQYKPDIALEEAKQEWDVFVQQEGTVIVVSNELGMGLHPMEKGGRDFLDLHGKINQYIAGMAQVAFFMVSGNPLKVK